VGHSTGRIAVTFGELTRVEVEEHAALKRGASLLSPSNRLS
jgi:hypothetical protein